MKRKANQLFGALEAHSQQRLEGELEAVDVKLKHVSANEKGATFARNPLILLAPRPGLEPGTYGFTEQHSVPPGASKPMIPNNCLQWTF